MNPSRAIVILLFSTCFAGCAPGESQPETREGYLHGAENASIHYRLLGSGPDTLVVIHGGPGAGIPSILPSVRPLGESFTLLLYDQRGGGLSELPEDTLKLGPEYHVEDLEAVRSHFGLDRMNVIAHSFGAVLVARYAQSHPQRLGRLLFHSATGPSRDEAAEYYRARAERSTVSPDTALSNRASQLLQSLLEGKAEHPVAACREYERLSRELAHSRGEETSYRGTTCEAPAEAVRYYYRHTAQLSPRLFGDWDFTEGFEELEAPLLVVDGKTDSLAHPMQRSWARAFPNARLLLEGSFSDNPDRILPAAAAFFNGSWPEGATLPTEN